MSQNKIIEWSTSYFKNQNYSFQVFEKTTSTNDEARKISELKNQIFLAKSQTKGRGRENNSWINSDLMMSCLYFNNSCLKNLDGIIIQILYESLKSVWPEVEFKIKKPNDIYIKENKLAGLLIEVFETNQKKLIIGLGLNVFNEPACQLFKPTCLKKEGALINEKTWKSFLGTFLTKVNQLLDNKWSNQ